MSTDTLVETETGLSLLDIKALKQADRWCFDYRHGESFIRCVKEVTNPGPFDDRDKEYRIPCEVSFCGLCRNDADGVMPRNCFSMTYNFQHSIESNGMLAVLLLLRKGDTLRLHWTCDNSNGYLADVAKHGERLYRDELAVVIRRNGKSLCAVHIDTSLCPNNSARMIRFA